MIAGSALGIGSAEGRRILLADDHPLFREALRAAVQRVAPTSTIEEVASLSEAHERLAQAVTPPFLMLDLKLPDSEGFSGLMITRAHFPLVPVAVVSARDEMDTAAGARALGARGFIPKSISTAQMNAALQALLTGGVWFPDASVPTSPDPRVRLYASLSPMQVKMLSALRRGLLNKQIAYELQISEATVKAHLTVTFKKLGVSNRTQALAKVFAS